MNKFYTFIFCLCSVLPSIAGDYSFVASDQYAYRIISEQKATVEVAECQERPMFFNSDVEFPSHVTNPHNRKEYTVVAIGSNIFSDFEYEGYDTQPKCITIPYSVETIGKEAFANCKKLKTVNFSEGIKTIGEKAFFGCDKIETLKLPATLVEIESEAFSGCESLETVIIPDEVTFIGSSAFGNCKGISKAVIGKSVEQISYGAFTYLWYPGHGGYLNASTLTDVFFLPSTPPVAGEAFAGNLNEKCRYHAPAESIDEYKKSLHLTDSYMVLPDVFAVFYHDKYYVQEGDQIELDYKIINPGNTEVVSMEWKAFNPNAVDIDDEIATGLKSGEMTTITLTITDENGNVSKSTCKVEVIANTAVGSILNDKSTSTEVFSINGVRVSDTTRGLKPGIYIIKENGTTKKIMIPASGRIH